MNRLRHLTLALAALVFSGCAFIHSLDENLPQQVEAWLQQREYAKVIDTLAYIHPDHPHYQKLAPLREIALQKALQYETYVLTRGKQLLDKQHWQQAHVTYERGLQKLPDSAVIQEAMQEFIETRDQYIRQLSYQLLFNKSQAILANRPIQEKINRAAPNNYHYRAQARQYEVEKSELGVELMDCAEYTLRTNQLVTSQKCLDLALKLDGRPLSKRQQSLQAKLNKKRKLLSQHLSKTAQLHLNAATEAMKQNRLKAALENLHKVPSEEQQKPAVLKLQKQLRSKIKQAVKQGAAKGRQLYSAGKIKEALGVWQSLLRLDPENPALLKLVERAQRVLKKLQTLEKKSGSKH